MPIIAIVLTAFLEQKHLLNKIRKSFNLYLQNYIEYFTNRHVNSQREIRYTYLFACLPVVIIVGLLSLLLSKSTILYSLFNLFIFVLCVNILTWKEEAKTARANYAYINTYATKFFATLFWYLVLPGAIGAICYVIIIGISNHFKDKGLDSLIYNLTVDKMLFYANIVPYSLLFVFIALAGNFEETMHYIVEQRKNFTKSFFFLENLLHEVILIAIGKEKFKLIKDDDLNNYATENLLQPEKFNPTINSYIIAILYRSAIFFIGLIAIIAIAKIL